MTDKNSLKGNIFEIQRFSVHDGPGIRTTVFMKGCPLTCRWCHNPEGIGSSAEIAFFPNKCIACGRCIDICKHGAHRMEDGVHMYDRTDCRLCGSCAEECCSLALTLVGEEMTASKVIEEVLLDVPFYKTSGGGMTLSGGEPTYQSDFACALLALAREAGVDCVVETSGHCKWQVLEQMLPMVSMFLFDIKDTDPERHEQHTGVGTDLIHENLRKLHHAGAAIMLRCPIVPGLNDLSIHFEGIAALANEMPNLLGVEIMPYHRLGEDKVARFGLDAHDRVASETPPKELIDDWLTKLRDLGVDATVSG